MLEGPAGKLEALLEIPDGEPVRACLVCHPHPLYGGTMHNKVVHRTARGLRRAGGAVLRFNFRGAGRSEGSYAQGIGELEDARAALGWLRERYPSLPYTLAGFSFGAYVQTRVAQALAEAGHPAQRLVLVGTAAGHVEGARKYETGAVASDAIVIHGAHDETVPLANVLSWAEPLDLPVIVVPGADHFFHRRLHVIRDIVTRAWRH